jgi:hypothetical protein
MKTPLPRRIFFWTLAVTYFITTASVLFFVFGYKHDSTSGIFIHTGSISIKSNPQKDITILINEKKPRSRLINFINNSYYIRGLWPRKYDVTVLKEGFKPWQKEVSVHSGISTEFWNITLVKNFFERVRYDIDDIDHFFPAPKENLFAMTRQLGQTLSVHVFDTKKDAVSNAFLFPHTTFTFDERENIEWAPNSENLIIPIVDTKSQKKDYAIAYTKENSHYLLSDFISLPLIHNVRWDPKDRNTVFLMSNTSLFRADLDLKNETVLLVPVAHEIFAYDFADDGIYLLKKDHRVLYDNDIRSTEFQQIAQFEIDKEPSTVRLIAYDKNRILIIDDTNNDLYIYNKADRNIYTEKIGFNIIGAHFSDDGKKLIYYSPFEIFAYFTRDWDAQPVRKENDFYSIIRFSQLIDNVHFSKDYEHVIYTVGNDIKITELDYRSNRITETVTTLNEQDNTIINKHKKNYLYFIDSTDNRNRQLHSIEFPEKQTLF